MCQERVLLEMEKMMLPEVKWRNSIGRYCVLSILLLQPFDGRKVMDSAGTHVQDVLVKLHRRIMTSRKWGAT